MLVVHVDDIVVVETVEKEVELKGPGREFKIKDLGVETLPQNWSCQIQEGNYYFKMQVHFRLARTNKIIGAKPVDTPIEHKHGLRSKSGQLLHNKSISKTG